MCVCVLTMFILGSYTHLPHPPRVAQLSIPQASDMALQDPKPLFFPPHHNGQGQNIRGKIQSLKSSLTYLTQGHYEQNKWYVGVNHTAWRI